MRLLPPLLVVFALLGLIAVAAPAQASDWVDGDGFKFRVPPGFEEIDIGSLDEPGAASAGQALEAMEDMLDGVMDADFHLYARGRGSPEEALLVAFAMHIEDERFQGFDAAGGLEAMEQGMRQALVEGGQIQGVPIEEGRVTRILVGDARPALEVVASMPDAGEGEPGTVRLLFVLDDAGMIMAILQGHPRNDTLDAGIWRGIVSSFQLRERGVLGLLFRYGPFLLGGLVLLIAVVWFLRAGRRTPTSGSLSLGHADGAPVGATGGGLSRAADGLPTYQGLPSPVLPGASSPERGAPAAPRTLKRADPVGAGAGAPPESAPPVSHARAPLSPPRIPRASAPNASAPGDAAPVEERAVAVAPPPVAKAPQPASPFAAQPAASEGGDASGPALSSLLGISSLRPSADDVQASPPPPPPPPPTPASPSASPPGVGRLRAPQAAERGDEGPFLEPLRPDMPTNVALRPASTRPANAPPRETQGDTGDRPGIQRNADYSR